MDLNYTRDTTSGTEGLALLPRVRALDPHVAVVVMTAWATIDLSVEAMRRGAADFVLKPWDNAVLLKTVRSQIAERERRIADAGGGPRLATDLALAQRVQSRLFRSRARLWRPRLCGACVHGPARSRRRIRLIDSGGTARLSLADARERGFLRRS